MRTIFSNEEVTELRKNPCVFSCTNNSVNYTIEGISSPRETKEPLNPYVWNWVIATNTSFLKLVSMITVFIF